MKTLRCFTMLVLIASMAMAGCATTDSSVPASTGVGAAAGALLGYGLTGRATGAAAGAGAGALAGALTGAVVDETRKPPAAQPAPVQPPPQSYQEPPPPSYQPAPQAYATQPDPTQGEFYNNTKWRVEIFVDDARDPVYLSSRESYPISLDVGDHRVMAKAYVATQFGERLVGTYNHTVYIDPKSSGWSLRFDENMF